MDITVCKFGGSSTADAGMFDRIRRIIESDGGRRYIVLSAPGGGEKVTDLLYRYGQARREGGDAEPALRAIARRFHAIAEGLGLSLPDGGARKTIQRAADLSEACLASRGEYLCAMLFSEYSGIPMADASELVCFDRSGKLDEPATLARFRDMAARLPRAVIPGFYGSDPVGNIVTFPRNGSDITGALAAAGVGASLYENWTDVPGLMTADPAADPGAKLIPKISYSQMRALSEGGARVLHPDCLGPVERAGIPTRIKCTMRPDSPGTLIAN